LFLMTNRSALTLTKGHNFVIELKCMADRITVC